ncbi:MAG TPA: hypothetical protein VME41_14460 [Stellaceae bacterium]|nr:hypothetical protein [Stellaceae bacterium]
MRKLCPFVAALLLALPTAASAATVGNPQTGFSADRMLQINNHIYVGKIWAMPGVERDEQTIAAFHPIFLLHRESPLGEAVLPQLKTIVEFVIPPEWRLLDGRDIGRQPIGSAVVNGVATTEYAVEETVPDGHAEGSVWLSRDGIPMKLVGVFFGKRGKPTRVRWELSHVRLGPQPAALFAAPHGYAKLPAEAIAPLLGLRLKSATRR